MYAIIGGGIGGLATALAFEKLNIDYRVFERASTINEVGAGIWLAPNALHVLDWLGLMEEIRAQGNTINQIKLAKADFSTLSDMEQSWVVEKFGFSTVAIHRARLQAILLNAVPEEKFILGKSFDSYELVDQKKVRLSFSGGSTFETDFLIGADGIHSRVRQQLFPESQLRYSGQTCWRGISKMELSDGFSHLAAELWGKQVRFGFSKISRNSVYWFAVKSSKLNQKEAEDDSKEKLIDLFSSFHPTIQDIIKNTPEGAIINNDIWDLKPMSQWHKDQICLVGDAAHATTPNMGQGAAQAIEDAYFLANQVHLHPDQVLAFEKFQSLRMKKVNQVVNQSWGIGKMAHWKFGRGLRNLMMRSIPDSVSRKKMIQLYQLDAMI